MPTLVADSTAGLRQTQRVGSKFHQKQVFLILELSSLYDIMNL